VSLPFKRRSCSILNNNSRLFNKIRLNAYKTSLLNTIFLQSLPSAIKLIPGNN
jgi:hypothetical protein